jgi:cephalosporin-C deacetylase
VNPSPQLSESAHHHPNGHVHDIIYTSIDEFQIRSWLLLPRKGKVRRVVVVCHGYGGRDLTDIDIPVNETSVLFPCFRGVSRGSRPSISSDPAWNVLRDIDKPDRYIQGGCVEDLWLAVSVLTRLYPELDERIGYTGTSFGGGIGALSISFDKRIDRGHLVMPAFGNMPIWLTLPTIGSAHSVQNYQKTHRDVIKTLPVYALSSADFHGMTLQ